MIYVLDTNTIIYYFKGIGQVASNMASISPTDLAIPTIVLFELHVGIAKSVNADRRRQQLNTFLGSVTVLTFTTAMAEASATIRAALEIQGLPIGPMDCLIAGTALAAQATLVTHNTREFSRV